MDRTSYADPVVAGLVADQFIPVRVDADRRPDISSRYTLAGGRRRRFSTRMETSSAAGRSCRPTGSRPSSVASSKRHGTSAVKRRGVTPPPSDPQLPPSSRGRSTTSRWRYSTAMTLGRRRLRRRPAVSSHGAGSPRSRTRAIRSGIAIRRDGDDVSRRDGVGRALRRGGRRVLPLREGIGLDAIPQSEKLLELNASMLTLYLDAFETLRHARYAERAEGVLGYVQQTLADAQEGGWAASQQEAPEYYEIQDLGARAARPAPAIDRTLLSAPNAAMVSAALRAARVMEDEGLRSVRAQIARARRAAALSSWRGCGPLYRAGSGGPRPARRSDCDGHRPSRCLRRHRQHRLRDDG